MAKKIRIVLDIPLKEERLKEKNIPAEALSKDILVDSDDVIDGVIVFRNNNLGDTTSEFYLDGDNAEIKSSFVIDEESSKVGWYKEAMDRLNQFQYHEGHSAQESLKFLDDIKVIIEKHRGIMFY